MGDFIFKFIIKILKYKKSIIPLRKAREVTIVAL